MVHRTWGRRLAAVLAALMLLTTASGCTDAIRPTGSAASASDTAQEKAKLVLYGWLIESHAVTRIHEDVVAALNERADLTSTVTARYIPGRPYYSKLNAALAANDGPDLFATHGAGVLEMYASADRLMPLDALLTADPAWKASFKPGVFDMLTVNERIYAIPVSYSTVALFYNKRIFDRYGLSPPKTYEELKGIIRVLTREDVTPLAFGAKTPWTAALFSEMVANRIGGDEPYEALLRGEGSWLDPSFLESGRIMAELRDMDAFPNNYLELDNVAVNRMFRDGEAAMVVTGSWSISELAATSALKDEVGVVKFPVFEGGKGDPDTWLGQPSYNIAVSSEVRDRRTAVELLKTLTSEPVQRRIAEESGDIPVIRLEPDEERMPTAAKELQREMAGMSGMFIFYDVGLGTVIGEAYNNTIQAILAGQSPEEAFLQLQMFTEAQRGG